MRFGARGRRRSQTCKARVAGAIQKYQPRRFTIISTLKIKGVPVTPSQFEVYAVLKTQRSRGLPDHALVPLAQHVSGLRLSSSGIRTRRDELLGKGLVADTGKQVKTGAGRTARVFKAVA